MITVSGSAFGKLNEFNRLPTDSREKKNKNVDIYNNYFNNNHDDDNERDRELFAHQI